MKREKKLSALAGVTLALLIPVAATFIFANASFGITGNPGTKGGGATVVQQDPQPTKKDIPFVQVDEMPVYPGGDGELLK